MVCNWKRTLVIFFLLLFLWPGTVWAQTDPEGSELASAMIMALQNEDAETFERLFLSDPNLTRRAYLSILEFAFSNLTNDPEATSEAGSFARSLAEQIQTTWGDSTPLQISDYLVAEDPRVGQVFAQYAATHYPAYASSEVLAFLTGGDSKSPVTEAPAEIAEYSPALNKAAERFGIKIYRVYFALAFLDFGLILQELNTYDAVAEEYRAALEAEGLLGTDDAPDFDELDAGISAVKLIVSAELGLSQDFDSKIDQLLAQIDDDETKAEAYFTGFRISLRQGRLVQARRYLDKARQAGMSSGNPVYRFSLDTASFQLRRAEGVALNAQGVLSAFEQAWGQLDNYRPMTNFQAGAAWTTGRHFARYWIDELAQLGEEGEQGSLLLFTTLFSWAEGYNDSTVASALSLEGVDLLTNIQGFVTFALTAADITYALLEQNPKVLAEVDVNVLLTPLDLGDDLAFLELKGSSFPPFDLQNAPLLKEIEVRGNYIRALDPKLPKSTRASKLSAVLPQMDTLERNESYIYYHLSIGKALAAVDRSNLAVTAWTKAYQKAEDFGYLQAAVEAASLLAEQYGQQENWTQASLYAGKANKSIQGNFDFSNEKSSNTSVLSSLTVKAHLKSNNPEKALEALSQGHQMSTANAQMSSNKEATRATKSLHSKQKQVATLTQSVQQLKALPVSVTRDELLNKAEKVLAETKSQFLLQSRNIRQKFSKLYTTALRFDPLNLPDIQQALPADTAVVQYFATGEELYIFVVTPTQFRLRSVAVGKSELDSTVIAFLRRIQRPKVGDVELDKLSGKLYSYLVAPIEADLTSSSTLILIPSGKLNVLPFGALQDKQGKPLLANKTIVELAKATDFMTLAGQNPEKISSVVTFANATLDLPAAEAEGEAIKKVFPQSQLFTGVAASKSNLMKFGSKAEVLHLATHGTWDPNHALNNHLMLSNNEKLAQEEIFNLDLSETSIVTLSACSTALADTKDVEFVASLAEAFWIAGSNSVVASLWQVDDDSTGLLMTNFYKHLKAGSGRGEALRKAQLEVRENPKFAHPYFWSGFLLFGDYR